MPRKGIKKTSDRNHNKRKAADVTPAVAASNEVNVQIPVQDAQPAKKQQTKVSEPVFHHQAEKVLDSFFGFSGVVVASFYAGLDKGNVEKYQRWRHQLPEELSIQLNEFQAAFSRVLMANEEAKIAFTDLISGSPMTSKGYGLVHLAIAPEAPGMRMTIFPSVFHKVESFLSNYDYAEVISVLFNYTDVLLAANKNWYANELDCSALAVASQSQVDSFGSSSAELSESLTEPDEDLDVLVSGHQGKITQSDSQSSTLQRSYSVSSASSEVRLTRAPSILHSMQLQAQQFVKAEEASLSQDVRGADSLPPVSNVLKRTISDKMARRQTPASIVPEQDDVLKYLFTILKYQFVTEGQQWFSPLILWPVELEGKVFSRVVKREHPVEKASILFENYSFKTAKQKRESRELASSIINFFSETHEIPLSISTLEKANSLQVRFSNIDQQKAPLYQLYKEGGYKQMLFFEHEAREERCNAIFDLETGSLVDSSSVASSSCASAGIGAK